jgi:tetratricopeptide (TPR) repeat protein
MTDEHDPSEPELEVGALDADDQRALDELDQTLGERAEHAEQEPGESGPAPRTERPRDATGWSSFFPQETIEQSRGFLGQLTPTQPPPPAAVGSGLLDVNSPLSSSEVSGILLMTSTAPPAEATAEVRSPSGGLISSILGQASGAIGDEGALTALRTLPRRAQPDLRDGVGREDAEQVRARIELLLHLAPRSQGAARARLQTAAAELLARRGEHDRAFASYQAARAADPSDRLVLRRLRREQLKRGLWAEAAALFRAEATLAVHARERSLALCAAAELDAASGAPATLDYATGKAALDYPATRAASEADPSSLLAGLLLAQRALSTGNKADTAAALRGSAASVPNGQARALLLVEAGRMLELTANTAGALGCYTQGSAADPNSIGALLGAQRLCTSTGDSSGAALALSTLASICGDARLSAELSRQRGQLLLYVKNDAASAVSALRTASTEPALRALARAAEAAGDVAEQSRALDAWAKMAGGAERGLALVELAALHAKHHQAEAAVEVFKQASAARAPGALLGVVRDALLRTQGDAALLDGFTSQSTENALRATAKLARDPARAAQELEALAKLPNDGTQVTADVLSFDAAAELGNVAHLQAALFRDAARWPKSARVGPLLAALDLAGGAAAPVLSEHWRMLSELAEGQPVVIRYLAARASSPDACAQLWLAEAEAASGEPAAFAFAMAGRYLELAGRQTEAIEVYADALDAVRGHPAGAFGLEVTARNRGDLAALERVHRELASTTESQHERSARRVRLGLLSADSDLEGALHWLELAAEDRPQDAVLDELCIRLSMDQGPALLAERLRNLAALESSPAFARAMKLRAAGACERAGQWEDAIRLYRTLLAQTPEDTLADCALLSALRQGGRLVELATELERRVQLTEEPLMWTPLLEDWAAAEQARGDSGRARMVLETLLERDPQHVSALRSLQRNAMIDRDDVRLASLSLRLFEALEQPGERAAELQLGMRFAELLGTDAAATVLRAEGRVRELWYVLTLEALALRSGDRSRSYEALRTLSQLIREPMERAAYALRAAEVMESAGPELAARELGATLLATPEHPLALEQVARLYKAAGQPRIAADNFERAALAAVSVTRSAPLFYTAGVLFQDELADRDRAIENLFRAAQSDVLFADTFARLRALLGDARRHADLKTLLEIRLAAPIEATLAGQLELERCALARQLGDQASAKQALSAAVRHDPAHARLWQELANMHMHDGEYREAAEALVQLARVADDDEALAEAFFRLGMLYDQELPDPRRAEIALTRVVALTPDDPRPAERLAMLFRRQGKHDQALRTLNHLIENAPGASTREEYVVLRALTLDEMGQHQSAEQALDEARRLAPASMRVLRAQNTLYERQGDKTALNLHLQRSCHALRAAIELDPGELSHWLGLCELLHARGRPDGVALVANMARALGLEHAELPEVALQGLGREGVRDAVQRRLWVRGPLDPLRVLMRDQSSAIARCLPFDRPVQAATPGRAQHVVDAVVQLFGLSELRLVTSDQPQCLPCLDEPLTVCVGRTAFLEASDAERFFLLTRAVSVAKLGCTLLVRSVPERVLLVLHALWTVTDPTHTAAVLDAHEQTRVTRELSAAILPAGRPKVASLIAELMGHDDVNPRRLAAGAFDFGSRVALMVTGNVDAALQALLRLRGRPPGELSLAEKLDLCRADSSLRALLSFAISEVYLEARRELGAPAAQDTD